MVRMCLAFAGIGSAAVLAYRGYWPALVLAVAIVLLPLARWVRGEFAGGKAWLREHPEAASGRHRKRRSLRDAVVYWATRAAQVHLP